MSVSFAAPDTVTSSFETGSRAGGGEPRAPGVLGIKRGRRPVLEPGMRRERPLEEHGSESFAKLGGVDVEARAKLVEHGRRKIHSRGRRLP
jgi:hypothetical protein